MGFTVKLDYQFCFITKKVHNEITDRMLPAKPIAIHLPVAQLSPEQFLRFGH